MTQISNATFDQWYQQFAVQGFPNGITTGSIPSFGLVYQLSTAQLLALNSTAVQLVPGATTGASVPLPPNGFALYPVSFAAEYVYGGTAFTIASGDNAFQIEYTGKAVSLASLLATGLVDQTVNTFARNLPVTPGPKFSMANSSNLGLEVKLVGTTPALTLGNGSVYLWLQYTALPLF